MTDAGGNNTLMQLSNEGGYTRYLLINDSVDSGQTIPFDGPSNTPVSAEDKVIILGAQDWTNETSAASGDMVVEYDETNKHFTFTDSGVSGAVVAIEFRHIPVGSGPVSADGSTNIGDLGD